MLHLGFIANSFRSFAFKLFAFLLRNILLLFATNVGEEGCSRNTWQWDTEQEEHRAKGCRTGGTQGKGMQNRRNAGQRYEEQEEHRTMDAGQEEHRIRMQDRRDLG